MTFLRQKYTDEWPEVKQVRAQIDDLEIELKKAPVEVLASMKSRADATETAFRSLELGRQSEFEFLLTD